MRRLLLLALLAAAAAAARAEPAPYAVGTLLDTWHDGTRDRDVPVKVYYPAEAGRPAAGTFPVIIFSHGLGGTREGYAYLGQAWAAHGYVSVHVQHLGSDDGAYKGTTRPLQKMRQAIADPENSVNRPLDVRFAIDQLYALAGNPNFILHGRLDLAHLGVAGHSFGAYTAMAVAGQAYVQGDLGSPAYPDPRIAAVIAMSTPTPARVRASGSFAGVKIPVFHMTGTEDVVKFLGTGSSSAIDRRIPYDRATLAPAYLLTFQGGDHMVFSGRVGPDRPNDPAFRRLVVEGSLAFWDGYLKGNADALRYLQGGGFAGAVGTLGVFEEKNLSAAVSR